MQHYWGGYEVFFSEKRNLLLVESQKNFGGDIHTASRAGG